MPIPAPPTIPNAPPVPNSALDEPAFDAQFESFLTWLSTQVQPGMNAAVENVAINAADTAAAAVTAVQSANNATAASDVSMGAINFKGMWTSLTGALAKPATVKHNGRFWLLLNNLANVTTSQPGVSADWTSLDAGAPITQLIASNTTAIAGVRYIIGAAGITLTLAASYNKGESFGVREAIANGATYTINFGAHKVRGKAWGAAPMRSRGAQLDLNYEDATRGFI